MASLRSPRLAFLLAGLVAACLSSSVAARDGAGVLIPVPSPITQSDVTRIKAQLAGLASEGADRPVAVFDFTPQDKPAITTEDGASAAADLAFAIVERTNVLSVAYFRQKVSGHSVLPVIACTEIVAGPESSLGEILTANDPPLEPRRMAPYVEISNRARPAFTAVVRKMFDKSVQLRKGRKGATTWFLDRREQAQAEADGVQLTDTAPLPAAADGAVALLTARQLVELGLAKTTAASRAEVAEIYGLPAGAALGGDVLNRPAQGFRYTVRGRIDGGVKEAVVRVVEDAIRNGATVIVLQLEAAGGNPQAALDLAGQLADIQAKEGVRVVAFVPDRAPDTAAIVALGCADIVLSTRTVGTDENAEPATLGDFDTPTGQAALTDNAPFWRTALRDLAMRQGHPALLAEGFVTADLEILQVSETADARRKRLMTPEELENAKAKFQQNKLVKARGQLLVLDAAQAAEYRLARTVPSRDVVEVYALYGLDPSKVVDAAPAWLDQLSAFLKLPTVTVLLVVIGFIGLILEMKVPGAAVPGIIAALCFILIFWAHTQFSGQVAVLAGLLFILGLVLVMLEVFVLPGFGVPGIMGIVFILGALGLATAGGATGALPSTTAEWSRLGSKMGLYMFAMMAAVAIAFWLVRFLPHIPGANMLALPAPDDSPAAASADVPGATQAAALLGAVGMTVTVLRPAGSVRFDDEFVDVVSEGAYIPAGARVQVVEVEGNRIVVREV